MSFGTHQHLSGILRGLILRRHELVKTADYLWQHIPSPREAYALKISDQCRLKSKGKLVLHDLLRLMFKEHDRYLDQIAVYLARAFREEAEPEGGWARSASYAMAREYRDLAAWHLAANRTEARLRLTSAPSNLPNQDPETWMRIDVSTPKRNVLSLEGYKSRKYFSV